MAKIKYEAEDGTQFDSYWDCQVYETKPENGGVQMYDAAGVQVFSVSEAKGVYFPNVMDDNQEYVLGAHWFIEQCIAEGVNYNGIQETSHGFFYFDHSYLRVDDDLTKILSTAHLPVY